MDIRKFTYGARLYAYSKSNKEFFLPSKVMPQAVTLKLTERCNSRCITCNYWQKQSKDAIGTRSAINLIGQLAELRIPRIRFSGGEPLLRNDFFDILREVREFSFEKITLATNGLLLKKFAEEINNSCLTDLGVSIDGLKETNDEIRGVQGYFVRVMEGLDHIRGKRITIMTTLSNRTHKELSELVEMCESRKYLWDYNLLDDRLYFLQNTEINSIWPSRDETDLLYDKLYKLRHFECMQRISSLQLNYMRKFYNNDLEQEVPCFMGHMAMFIDSQGGVLSGCHYFPPVDNIKNRSVSQILGSESYHKRLLQMLKRNCNGCTCGYGVNESISHLPNYAISQLIKRSKRSITKS